MKLLANPFLILSLAFVCIQVNAQDIKIKGGLNYSSASYKYNGDSFSGEQDYKMGYQMGANAIIPISNIYSINAGALFVNRKHEYSKTRLQQIGYEVAIMEANRWYFEIPVLLRREFKLSNIAFFGEAGPYVGMGFGGEYDLRDIGDIIIPREYTSDVMWGSKEDEIKRFDFGVALGFGVLINKLEIGISYEQGLVNYLNAEGSESKNRAFILNCAYPIFSFK